MKFKDYLEKLNELAKTRPEVLEYEVITAKDAEGNGYNLVYYSASVGYYDGNYCGDFYNESGMVDYEIEEPCNAVCVN